MFKNLFGKSSKKSIDENDIIPEKESNPENELKNDFIEIKEENPIKEEKDSFKPDMIKSNKAEMMYQLALKEFSKLLFDNPRFNPAPFTDDMNKNDYATYLQVTNLVKRVAKTDLNLAVDLFEVMKEAVRVGTLSDALNEGKKLLSSRLEEQVKSK